MPAGRPRKPTHLKVVSGTLRKHRENPDEPVTPPGVPVSPDWLSGRATAIFAETCAVMERMGTLSAEWADVIAAYASSMEEVEITTAIIEDLGRVYTTTTVSGDTMFRPRPEVAMRDAAMRRAHLLRTELGIGPAAKSRVASSRKKGEDNPFKKLG